MSQTHDEIRALRVMVDELRAEAAPDLDFSAMERRLLSRIAEQPASLRRAAPSSGLARVLGFAAAAAAIALGVTTTSSRGQLPVASVPEARAVEASAVALAPGAVGASGAHDLTTLRVGDEIEARDTAVSFGEAGLVTWTLLPGSVARVRSTGLGHTVALERGEIRAEVTPREASEGLVEAFAVEVAHTRVAVHGTAFSVKIEGNQAVVDVDHGAVAVGPTGHVGATTGHLLVGPSRATFSLDGGRTARLLARAPLAVAAMPLDGTPPAIEPEPARVAPSTREDRPADPAPAVVAARPSAPVAAAPARPAVEPALEAPLAPPAPEPARITAGTVRARLARCFKDSYESAPSAVKVSVSSTLRVDLKADGSVRAARFDPPLKPEIQLCAGGAISGRFAEGETHLDIPVSYTSP